MSPRDTSNWGTLEQTYTDEFGPVAPDVYVAAGRLWQQAQSYAARILDNSDPAHTHTLLIKAAAQVTQARDVKARQIAELEGYLFQTFKNLVLSEYERVKNHLRLEQDPHITAELRGQAETVERRILMHELAAAMDEWTRAVLQWRAINYTFEEIGRHLGENPKVVRNRFDRNLKQLGAKLQAHSRPQRKD